MDEDSILALAEKYGNRIPGLGVEWELLRWDLSRHGEKFQSQPGDVVGNRIFGSENGICPDIQ